LLCIIQRAKVAEQTAAVLVGILRMPFSFLHLLLLVGCKMPKAAKSVAFADYPAACSVTHNGGPE